MRNILDNINSKLKKSEFESILELIDKTKKFLKKPKNEVIKASDRSFQEIETQKTIEETVEMKFFERNQIKDVQLYINKVKFY